MQNLIYLETSSTNPAFNLALEEVLLNSVQASAKAYGQTSVQSPVQAFGNNIHSSGKEVLATHPPLPDVTFAGYFLLWQNSPSVIIGRHQNAKTEVNLTELARRKIALVRRPTGGGAVYHDLGNLNFTFLLPQKPGQQILPATVLQPLLNYLKSLGLQAFMQGRNDISITLPQNSAAQSAILPSPNPAGLLPAGLQEEEKPAAQGSNHFTSPSPLFADYGDFPMPSEASLFSEFENFNKTGKPGRPDGPNESGESGEPDESGKPDEPNFSALPPTHLPASAKISGLASRQLPGCYQQHGTILFDVDLSVLEQVLLVDPAKYKTKGVASVKARVTNLKPYLKLTLNEFWAGIKHAYQPHSALPSQTLIQQAKDLSASKYSQNSWNIGQSPPANIVLKQRFSFGSLELHLVTQKNHICAAKITGDFILHAPFEPQTQNIINNLSQALVGLPVWHPKLWAKAWSSFDLDNNFLGQVNKQEILTWLAKGE